MYIKTTNEIAAPKVFIYLSEIMSKKKILFPI